MRHCDMTSSCKNPGVAHENGLIVLAAASSYYTALIHGKQAQLSTKAEPSYGPGLISWA